MKNEDQQFSLLESIEVHEFLYEKEDIVRPHASLWGDFNFSLNGILEIQVEEQIYLSPPSYGLWIPPQTVHLIYAELSGDFPLGDSRQPIYKSLQP
ncbi:AraC family transcriptional regulator, partial [Acinetobacter baumannii]